MVYTIPAKGMEAKFVGTAENVADAEDKESISKSFSNLLLFGMILLAYIGIGAFVSNWAVESVEISQLIWLDKQNAHT